MSLLRALEIQPRLSVASLLVSHRFYHDVLGFIAAEGEPTAADSFAILQRDNVGLQLVIASADHPFGRMTVWLHVSDALAEYERIKDSAQIEWGPEVYWYGCREFAVLDPDGHRIVFSSPTDESPACHGEA